MKHIFLIWLFVLFTISHSSQAQICGTALVAQSLNITAKHVYPKSYKTAEQILDSTFAIPIIFHIILDTAQIRQLNGIDGIQERVDSQLSVINYCFNNVGSTKMNISDDVKHFIGNPNIKFGLAQTDPEGNYSKGYEIVIADKNGFEYRGNYGSTYAFCDCKYSFTGGCNIWDPSTYLNVWIINTLSNGSSSAVSAVTIPPSFTVNTVIPEQEMGIVLNYSCFGFRTDTSQFFTYNRFQGNTLTHELGHYFGLWHTWGDDYGLCPTDIGGNDDSIADTPPQGGPTEGCPTFPLIDNCSDSTGLGVFFMNFMDYADDTCRYMFTGDQCKNMNEQLLPGGELFTLNKHKYALAPPSANTTINDNDFVMYPNPANNEFHIFFPEAINYNLTVFIYSYTGALCRRIDFTDYRSDYKITINDLKDGLYIVRFTTKSGVQNKKIFFSN